ncbi:MAG: pitrilysin family protein [Candidatus Shapirobacteria bacterium]
MEEKTKYQIFTLKNGIRGVIVPILGLKSVTVEVFLKIGSKYEVKGEFGMSHFLEHMAFKGTKKRPLATDINNEIDSKGATYNAGTGHEMTSYYITTVKDNLTWAVEMISDILFNSTYPLKEVNKERGVVIEEIRMYQDNPMMGMSGEFTKFFYDGSKIGCWNIAGEVNDIKPFNREKLIKYHDKYFNPKETVVVISGNVDQSAESIIKEYFEAFINNKAEPLPKVEVVLNQKSEKIIKKEIEQGHFCIGVPALRSDDERKYALKLLDIILSGNSSSRLYTKIREERALAYYVFSISESFTETGFLGVQSGVKLDKLKEAQELVINEFLTIKDNLKEEELKRAKEFLMGKTQLAMDKSSFMASYVGQKILLENDVESIEKEIERYNKVELSELKDLCELLFKKDKIKSLMVTK